MKKILITGATGNIGTEVIRNLLDLKTGYDVVAAVRNPESAENIFKDYPDLDFRQFDFEDKETFRPAFKDINILFLLRPPYISKVQEYFQPLLKAAKKNGIGNIVFLSVQGAEKSEVIPHNKIESLIRSIGFNYIFVRPSYYMQNLTTSLLPEIQENGIITLPAGQAKFNWIDARNIGEAVAVLIQSFDRFRYKAYEITGTENRNFEEVAALMSKVTGIKIGYRSLNPVSFYFKKRKGGVQSDFALVMTLLHFLPRLQKEPKISNSFKLLTGKEPTTLIEFLEREKEKFRRREKS